MTTPRKLTPAPLPGHPGVTVTPMHAPGSPSGYYVVTMAPGAEMAEHAHPQAETIVACELLGVVVNGRSVLLHQGEALDIPPGVPHAVAGSHVREVRYVSIATPDWGQAAPMLVPASVALTEAQVDALRLCRLPPRTPGPVWSAKKDAFYRRHARAFGDVKEELVKLGLCNEVADITDAGLAALVAVGGST